MGVVAGIDGCGVGWLAADVAYDACVCYGVDGHVDCASAGSVCVACVVGCRCGCWVGVGWCALVRGADCGLG